MSFACEIETVFMEFKKFSQHALRDCSTSHYPRGLKHGQFQKPSDSFTRIVYTNYTPQTIAWGRGGI